MIEKHQGFESPEEDRMIWRYMSFAKVVAMDQQQALFFSRADKLGDPFEGSITRLMAAVRDEYLEEEPEMVEELRREGEDLRQSVYVNCWHMNDNESEAMWKLYVKGEGEGIAIQSTYGRLRACLEKSVITPIHIGQVQYLDFAREEHPSITAFDTLSRFLLKRASLEHERELRAVLARAIL